MTDASAAVFQLVEDLFRREFSHLTVALARLLGPSELALVEDLVQDALLSAMHAWRFGAPDDPKAWILEVARRRAIDLIRRNRRLTALETRLGTELAGAVDVALAPEADADNQLLMMLAICDPSLAAETHVTLILRILCGLSPGEIARAFLVDVKTVERRLHRGRTRLKELGELREVRTAEEIRARQPSLEQALYLLFNEGYHGSDPDDALQPALCADALRLSELLLASPGVEVTSVHALSALFCLTAARLPARKDATGVFLPLAEQDRALWDRGLIVRGICHLGESAGGAGWTRWHLEAGIAFEHAGAASVEATNWPRIVEYYDVLSALSPGPVVALNRGLAIAEARGLEAGRRELDALAAEPRLAQYSFYWAARADIERRAGQAEQARSYYLRAIELAKSAGERAAYERRLLPARDLQLV